MTGPESRWHIAVRIEALLLQGPVQSRLFRDVDTLGSPENQAFLAMDTMCTPEYVPEPYQPCVSQTARNPNASLLYLNCVSFILFYCIYFVAL